VPTSILFLVKGNNGLKFFVISAFNPLRWYASCGDKGTEVRGLNDVCECVTNPCARQEILAGTAAYCAVLVVFLSNVVTS